MIDDVKKELEKDLKEVKDLKELYQLKIKYLSKNGLITKLNSSIKDVDPSERAEFGKKVNEVKVLFNICDKIHISTLIKE